METFLPLLHPVVPLPQEPPSVCPDAPILSRFSGAGPVDHPFYLQNVQPPPLNWILPLTYKYV